MTLAIDLLGVVVGVVVVLPIVASRGTEPRPGPGSAHRRRVESIKVEHLLVGLAIGVVVAVQLWVNRPGRDT
ncbi:MAG: hypothetical protein ACRD0A_01595 [Acidimicrobiales bacterium]